MRIKLRALLFLLSLAMASCNDDTDHYAPQSRTIDVTIGSQPRIGIQSRSALEDDGETIRWVKGDSIALWGVNAAGSTVVSAAPLVMYHYNETYQSAKFTGTIPVMADGTYDYFAVAPQPSSVEGLKASFQLPSIQEFKTAELGESLTKLPYDVMVATPVRGAKALTKGDNSNRVSFSFQHKVHLLKVVVKANTMGQKVSEVMLTFPQPVVGTLTVDASTPDAEPELTDAGNDLLIRFDQPVEDGTTVYAAIAPVDLTGQEVKITSYGETHASLERTFAGKNFAAGHITPLGYTIPAQGREFAHLTFKLPADKGISTLGEEVTHVKLTAPENVTLGGGSTTLEWEVGTNAGETIMLRPMELRLLMGKTLTAQQESESAVISDTFTVPSLTDFEANTATLAVPYLMDEDFSRMTSNFSGSAATGDAGGEELSDKGLPGWYAGARSQGYAGVCVNLQHYNNIGGPYLSRIDSAPLSGIKAGKTISVKVVFNSDWKKNKSGSMKLTVGRTTGHSLNSAISNSTDISMSNNSSASRTNIPTLRSVTVANITASESIAWKTNGANATFGFVYEDVFIDNIKISIVQ